MRVPLVLAAPEQKLLPHGSQGWWNCRSERVFVLILPCPNRGTIQPTWSLALGERTCHN